MEFKYVLRKEKVVGKDSKNFLLSSEKEEISKEKAISLLKKGSFSGFKNLGIYYKDNNFYYGSKKINSFEDLLKEVAKDSKRNKVTLIIET